MLTFSQARYLLTLIAAILTLAVVSAIAEDIEVTNIAFVNELHGWVFVYGTTPAIFSTTDGGKTWVRTPIAAKNGFNRIHFFDENTGMAISYESAKTTAIYRTEDAGRTWKKVNTIKTKDWHPIVELTLTSQNEGFLVGVGNRGRGYVAQFSDGGRTIKVRKDLHVDNEDHTTLGVFGDGTGHVWIVGLGLILHSADGGKTWENQAANVDLGMDIAMSGTALPGGHAWISAGPMDIFVTHDYGKHWISKLSTNDKGNIHFSSLSFFNALQGCAVGDSSFIYCTKDGGATWSRTKAFPTYENGSLFSSKLFLFASAHGWASVNGALYKTEDGGNSFTEVLTSSQPPESDIPGETQALKTNINGPTELAYDKAGFLYIVEAWQERVLRLDIKHSSIKVVVAEPGDVADNVVHETPNAIAFGPQGDLFIKDWSGRLRKLDTRSGKFEVLFPTPPKDFPNSLEGIGQIIADGDGSLLIASGRSKLFRWRVGAPGLETVADTEVRAIIDLTRPL